MSLLETPMTLRYWEAVGGTLVEEFQIVSAGPSVGRRLVDAVIILNGERRRATRGERLKLDGKDVIVVQTKASRVGMDLLGQALFSRVLIEERFALRSVRTVALCTKDDAVLHPIAERFGIEVVVDDPTSGRPGS